MTLCNNHHLQAEGDQATAPGRESVSSLLAQFVVDLLERLKDQLGRVTISIGVACF